MKRPVLFLITLYFISCVDSISQNMNWEVTNGPPGANIFAIYKKNNEIITNDYNGNVWISSDYGINWTKTAPPPGTGLDVLRFGSTIIVGNYRSPDDGVTWQSMPGFTIPIGANHTIRRFALDGTSIYAAGMNDSRIHMSTDQGNSWQDVTYNLPPVNWDLDDMIIVDSMIYVAEWADGIYCRHVNDTVWTTRNTGVNLGVSSLFGKGNSMYAGTNYSGMYYSSDKGLHWTPDNIGLSSQDIRCFAGNDSIVFAGTDRGLFRTIINSRLWTEVQGIPKIFSYTRLSVSGDTIFAGTNQDGLIKSYDGGSSWYTDYKVSHGALTTSMTGSNDYIFAASENRFFRTADMGTTWEALTESHLNSIFYNNNYIYGGYEYSGGIFYSHDNGATWIYSDSGLTSSPVHVTKFEAMDSTIFLMKDYLYKSIDHGFTWTQVNVNATNEQVYILCRKGADLYVANSNKLFKSSDAGISWSQILSPPAGYGFIGISATNTAIFLNAYATILQSTDDGFTWQSLANTGLPAFNDFNFITTLNNELYAYPHSYGPHGDDIFYDLYKYQTGSWEYMTDTVPRSYLEYNGYIFGGTSIGIVKALNQSIPTSIPTKLIKDDLFVYPNPFIQEIHFNYYGKEKIKNIKIYNAKGVIIYNNVNVSASDIKLNLPLSSGLYLLEINTKNERLTRKIVKK